MSPLSLEPPIYEIGELRFSRISGVLEISDEKVVLRAREANLLTALIESFPDVLSRNEIEAKLWKDSYATNATINQTVKSLRFSLKDEERSIVRTIPKQGYVLSKKPVVIEEIEPQLIEANDGQIITSRHAAIFEPKVLLPSCVAIVATFLFGLAGVGKTELPQMSTLTGSSWYLMDSIPKGLQNRSNDEFTNAYVMHSGNRYRVCQINEEVMQCKNLEL